MINWFNMPDEGLSNGGLFEVKELEVTENGTYEQSGEMYNKVTVNVSGGGSSDFVSLHLDENFALNKTWQEISDLLTDGKILVVIDHTGDGGIPAVVSSAINSGGNYWVRLYQNLEGREAGFYYASSANDYPVYD